MSEGASPPAWSEPPVRTEEEFARVYGKDARTVVVLYRIGWGDRGFTAAEAVGHTSRATTS